MSKSDSPVTSVTDATNSRRRLLIVSLCVETISLLGVAWLSWKFRYGSDELARPILLVVSLLSVAFIAQMMATWSVIKLPDTKRLLSLCFGVAVAYRILFFTTPPIQEVDLYRYLWDGAVVCEGISPYRYSPQSIVASDTKDPQLKHLTQLIQQRPGLATVRDRVHYPQVTTVYPPISQCVFASATMLIPDQASVATHVAAMKAAIILFDVATLGLIVALLRSVNMHAGWSIVYGWSPLVLKEFANSGHLDSIAVLATVAGVLLLVRSATDRTLQGVIASAICLGLGIGAKLFPVVLLPVCAAYLIGKSSLRRSLVWSLFVCLTTIAAVAPMMVDRLNPPELEQAGQEGLQTFLSQWEMNDLIFMVVEENLRPDPVDAFEPKIWFAWTPASTREKLTSTLSSRFGLASESIPFLLTRAITSAVFLLLALFLAWSVSREPDQFLPAVFLTLAWFWLLSPTQNPWYWTWALPFVVFHRNRMWLLIAAATMVYYCRFWFEYHQPKASLFGQTYRGVSLFDFVIVWIEFLPALGLIAIGSLAIRRKQTVRSFRETSDTF